MAASVSGDSSGSGPAILDYSSGPSIAGYAIPIGESTSALTTPRAILSGEALTKLSNVFYRKIENDTQALEAAYESCIEKKWDRIQSSKDILNTLFSNEGLTLLTRFIKEYNIDVATELIKREVCVHTADHDGNLPIHFICQFGGAELLEEVRRHNFFNDTNDKDQSPLHLAVLSHNHVAIEYLLEKGANANAQADLTVFHLGLQKVTPLHLAVIMGDQKALEIILSHPKSFESSLQIPGIGNILHLVIHFQNDHLLKLLLTEYFDQTKLLLEEQNSLGQTPLMLSAYEGNGEAIIRLQKAEASLERKDQNGWEALHWAVAGRQSNSIDLLLHFGCSLQAVNAKNERPVDLLQNATDNKGTSIRNYLCNVGIEKQSLKTTHPLLFEYREPENLVYKGGGPKGVAYVGVQRVLEEEGILPNVKRVAGTSAGAINATLLAFGYCAEEMEILLEKNLTDFLDHPFKSEKKGKKGKSVFKKAIKGLNLVRKSLLAVLKTPWNPFTAPLRALWRTTGICKGEEFRKWIEDRIKEKTGVDYCTFGELAERIRRGEPFKHLYVFASNISTEKPECFNSEDPACKDIIISDVVRASMSIPGIFLPYTLREKVSGEPKDLPERGTYVDGGLIANFPLWCFDQRSFLPTAPKGEEGKCHVINPYTLGFKLFTPIESKNDDEVKKVDNIGKLLKGILGLYYEVEERVFERAYENRFRTIEVSNEGVKTTEFNLSGEKRNALIRAGEIAARAFFAERKKRASPTNAYSVYEQINRKNQGIKLRAKNIHFTGRNKELGILRETFKDLRGITKYNVYGPTGIGKTELVVEFANADLHEFSLVWTIQAGSELVLIRSYQELSRHLGLYFAPNDSLFLIQTRVHNFLERRNADKPFLLIIDNAQQFPEMPQRGNGGILITSKKKFLEENSMEVKQFSSEESEDLLIKILPEREHLSELARALRYYPLALSQVAYYIRKNHMSIDEYVQRLDKNKGTVLGSLSPFQEEYQLPLIKSWELTLNRFEQDHPNVLRWIEICSLLAPEEIDVNWIHFFLHGIEDPLVRDLCKEEITNTLEDYGLISFSSDRKTFSVQGFTQDVIKVCLSDEKKVELRAIQLLQKSCRELDPQRYLDWEALRVWEVHANFLIEKRKKLSKEEADIAVKLGEWLLNQGKIDAALQYLQKGHATYSWLYDKLDHPDLALSTQLVGLVLLEKGRHEEAKKFVEDSLEMRRRIHPRFPHADVATSLYSLGKVLDRMGNWEEASQKLNESFSIWNELLGETAGPGRAASLLQLGTVHAKKGDFPKALDFLSHSYKMMKKVFGDKPHPAVAGSANNLGLLCLRMGKLDKARSLFEESLAIFKSVYGNQAHPHFASSLNAIGEILELEDKLEDAWKYFKDSYEMEKVIHGPGAHENVAASLHNLGLICRKLKQYEGASQYLEDGLKMQKEIFGDIDHAHIAASLHEQGVLLVNQQKFEDGYKKLREGYEMQKRVYKGEPHLETAESLFEIGLMFRQKRDYAKAFYFFDQSYEMSEKVVGEDPHPLVADSLHQAGVMFLRLRKTGVVETKKLAIKNLRKSLSIKEEVYGADHKSTRKTKKALGHAKRV